MAWDFISISTAVVAANGDITLNAPASAAEGDLLVACIGYRDSAAFTLPANWNIVATQQSSGDTQTPNSGIGSGLMAYIVRGASAPSYVFTRTAGDVAIGVVLCYRGNSATPYDTGNAETLGTIGEPSLSGITTAEAGELLVTMVAPGDNTAVSTFDAVTNPATASGSVDTTTEPTDDTWIQRHGAGTNTGADVYLGIADGIKATAGATGTISADATATSRSVSIVGAFKLAASSSSSSSSSRSSSSSSSSNSSSSSSSSRSSSSSSSSNSSSSSSSSRSSSSSSSSSSSKSSSSSSSRSSSSSSSSRSSSSSSSSLSSSSSSSSSRSSSSNSSSSSAGTGVVGTINDITLLINESSSSSSLSSSSSSSSKSNSSSSSSRSSSSRSSSSRSSSSSSSSKSSSSSSSSSSSANAAEVTWQDGAVEWQGGPVTW